MKIVKKAYFPYNIILWIFKKTSKNKNVKVAMVDPLWLNILTIGAPYALSEKHYRHESRHIAQVKNEGRIKFIFKYIFYLVKYGYINNPYEVDARKYAEAMYDEN